MNMHRLVPTTIVATLLCGGLLHAADAPKLESQKDKLSYAIGMNIGGNLKAQNFDVDPAVLAAGIRDMMAGAPAMTEEEARTVVMGYQQEMRAKMQEKAKAASSK